MQHIIYMLILSYRYIFKLFANALVLKYMQYHLNYFGSSINPKIVRNINKNDSVGFVHCSFFTIERFTWSAIISSIGNPSRNKENNTGNFKGKKQDQLLVPILQFTISIALIVQKTVLPYFNILEFEIQFGMKF